MARGRMLSKSLSTSEKRARLRDVLDTCPQCGGSLAEFAQALYPLLVAHADDWGRLQGDCFTVKHQIDPTSPRSLDEFWQTLEALHFVGLVQWYIVDGRKLITIVDFEAHQTGLHKRTQSKFPSPSADSVNVPDTSGKFREIPGHSRSTKENRTKENVQTHEELVASTSIRKQSSTRLVQPDSTNEDGSAPFDEWLRQLTSDYPQHRIKHGYLTESAFVEQFRRDERDAQDVWREMRDNLENQKRGYEWRVKRMIPMLDTWLREGRWRQRHEEQPADALSPRTQRSLAAADRILREEEET